jgi:hypothetical protein
MDEPELKNEHGFAKEERLLLNLLLAYCVGVSLCRLFGADLRYIAHMDWTIYRKDLPARLPFYLMPLIALAWLKLSRYGRYALFFTAGMSIVGILDHGFAAFRSLRFGLPFFRLTGREPLVRINVLLGLILAIGFAILAWNIFQASKRLYSQKTLEKQPLNTSKTIIALVVLLFCHISPFMDYKELARQMVSSPRQSYTSVKLLHAGSDIRYMAGSPDGKLLAIGTDKGLSVWDAESQQCVWSDDVLRKVHRTRFSPSGKYLAAVGRGVPEGSSDIAVYEVEGFKRLPDVELLEEDLTKEKIFHDVAFRPDEKSLLVAWHRDWDYEQIPGGYYGAEAKAIYWREGRITPIGTRRLERDLVCTELNLEGHREVYSKTIKTLSVQYDLLLSGGIGFSPSASYLLYPNCYSRNNLVARNRLYMVDTRSWEEEEIMLDSKYSMLVGGGLRRYSDWYEWKITRDEKDIYLLAQEKIRMNTIAYLLLKLNLKTKETQEIIKIPKPAEVSSSAWTRIALFKDEEKVALLLRGEPVKNNYGKPRGELTVLRLIDLNTKETELIAYLSGNKSAYGWRIVWLSEGNVAVAMYEKDEFFFGKMEGK